MEEARGREMTLSEFFESIPHGDIDQDCRDAPCEAGLYVIVNTVTWKAYIGQSQMIATRFMSHRSALRGSKHSNRRLQEDWNKYGEAIFRFCVFEIMDASLLFEAESQLISSSFGSCYNYCHALPSRKAAKHIGGYFDSVVSRRLRHIALEEDSSVQTLLGEALDLLFQSRRMPTIALIAAEKMEGLP